MCLSHEQNGTGITNDGYLS
jgi:hypothetical protein